MLTNIKIITIFGTKGVGKSTLFWQLVKLCGQEKSKKIIDPIINYAESLVKIHDKTYKLIDTPSFILSPKTEIEKGVKEQTDSLLKSSSLIC
ncbi:MAG: 50S ribosome-binding GTPase [Mollicutes bacterium UO1]